MQGTIMNIKITYFLAHCFLWCTFQQAATIVEILQQNPHLSTYAAALKNTELLTLLSGKDCYTVFAPTNEAFALLPCHEWECLQSPYNKIDLITLLKYHIVRGKYPLDKLRDFRRVNTVIGEKLTLDFNDAAPLLIINKHVRIIQSDIKAKNGIIHIIDAVLLPSTELELTVSPHPL